MITVKVVIALLVAGVVAVCAWGMTKTDPGIVDGAFTVVNSLKVTVTPPGALLRTIFGYTPALQPWNVVECVSALLVKSPPPLPPPGQMSSTEEFDSKRQGISTSDLQRCLSTLVSRAGDASVLGTTEPAF